MTGAGYQLLNTRGTLLAQSSIPLVFTCALFRLFETQISLTTQTRAETNGEFQAVHDSATN